MNLLLDSCAMLDIAVGAPTLTEQAKSGFENATNNVYLSSASIWELGLKRSLGTLDFDVAGLAALLPSMGIQVLDIDLQIALLVNQLPYHHKDPFDRIIISTAKAQSLTVITSDAIFAEYGVDVIACR
ncbi:MAG TPA: type II toxin-antitoxin system VapC family toxin [Marinagarivorans sp.]